MLKKKKLHTIYSMWFENLKIFRKYEISATLLLMIDSYIFLPCESPYSTLNTQRTLVDVIPAPIERQRGAILKLTLFYKHP